MKTQIKSIFNLIEIFRTGKRKVKQAIQPELYCKTNSVQDYYCDQEHIGIWWGKYTSQYFLYICSIMKNNTIHNNLRQEVPSWTDLGGDFPLRSSGYLFVFDPM